MRYTSYKVLSLGIFRISNVPYVTHMDPPTYKVKFEVMQPPHTLAIRPPFYGSLLFSIKSEKLDPLQRGHMEVV